MQRIWILLCACTVLPACGANDDTRGASDAAPAAMSGTAGPVSNRTVSVSLSPTAGNAAVGTLMLEETSAGVRVRGHLANLPPDSELGFHVHQVADCSAPDASSAGDHLNPGGQPHGAPDAEQSHLGDMPNLEVDGEGAAEVDVVVDRATLDIGERGLLNRAIVVHGQTDDHETQPSGSSGDPIACGAIPAMASSVAGDPPAGQQP